MAPLPPGTASALETPLIESPVRAAPDHTPVLSRSASLSVSLRVTGACSGPAALSESTRVQGALRSQRQPLSDSQQLPPSLPPSFFFAREVFGEHKSLSFCSGGSPSHPLAPSLPPPPRLASPSPLALLLLRSPASSTNLPATAFLARARARSSRVCVRGRLVPPPAPRERAFVARALEGGGRLSSPVACARARVCSRSGRGAWRMGGKGHHRSASNVNPNLNTNWVGYPGTWTAYVALLLLFWCCLYPILDYDAGRCVAPPRRRARACGRSPPAGALRAPKLPPRAAADGRPPAPRFPRRCARRCFTYLNIVHSLVTFYLFHWNKGSPVQADQVRRAPGAPGPRVPAATIRRLTRGGGRRARPASIVVRATTTA